MAAHEIILEPFTPQTLEAIRKAFQAGWNELAHSGAGGEPTRARNRLIGTIANLASKGILDPDQLKDQAIRSLSAAALQTATAPQGSPAGLGQLNPSQPSA